MNTKKQKLLNGNLRKLLFTFSLPTVVGMIVASLYNLVDTIFVGKGVGPLAIAAITLILPIMMVFLGGVVGGLMIAMYLPIFEMAGSIKVGG